MAVYKNNSCTLRIRDNCNRFDPKEYLKLSDADNAEHVGIRLVAGMAKSINYQNVFGMNMLTIEVAA